MSTKKTALLTAELVMPTAEHGAAVHKLIAECPPLDTNSMYCNLLQSSHFADTAVAAIVDEQLIGFISGYRIPQRPNTLFVWQVAVGEQARGQGLAQRMLKAILMRESSHDINHIETTITANNRASWALFESLARQLDTNISSSVMFERQQHFADQHDTEMLVRIGPFNPITL